MSLIKVFCSHLSSHLSSRLSSHLSSHLSRRRPTPHAFFRHLHHSTNSLLPPPHRQRQRRSLPLRVLALLLLPIAISRCEREDKDDLNPPEVASGPDIFGEVLSRSTISLKDLQMILHESIATSAVVSLRESREIAHDFAKILVIDILNNPESTNNLGSLLGSLFEYESVRFPTRDLIYWSLTLDPTLEATYALGNEQVAYWCIGEGNPYTKSLLLYWALWWLRDQQSYEHTLKPLIVYVTEIPEVQDSLTQITAESLPYTKVRLFDRYILLLDSSRQETCVEAISAAVSELLKANETK